MITTRAPALSMSWTTSALAFSSVKRCSTLRTKPSNTDTFSTTASTAAFEVPTYSLCNASDLRGTSAAIAYARQNVSMLAHLTATWRSADHAHWYT